jgi:predicted P-loop ATPase
MSKVFITQEQTKLNYLPAEKFGEIVFITCDEFSPVSGSLSNVNLTKHIWDTLMDFDPEEDYIVFSGSPTVAAAVFSIIGKMDFDAFRVLRWSNRDSMYTPITLNIKE